jgi:small subunit ribosomal protein S17
MKTRGQKKIETGTVVRHKQDKTAVVTIETFTMHKLYRKRIRRAIKVYAHDEKNISRLGDVVQISESRPLSKTKRWRIVKVIQHSKVAIEQENLAI